MHITPSPDPPTKGLPPWLVFGFLVVVPPTLLIAFARSLTQNPILIALIIIGYEVLIFFGNIFSKIWQKFEIPFVNFVSERIQHQLPGLYVSYTRYYLQHLIYLYRDFDVKGLSTQGIYTLHLEQVFVELCIDPTAAHQVTTDPLQTAIIPRTESHPIWDYLTSETLSTQHLVIIGPPGSGKTTLLKYLAITLANDKNVASKQRKYHKLPILLFLRDLVAIMSKDESASTLIDVVKAKLNKWSRPVPSEWLEYHLNEGNCLILMDGLDEVADLEVRHQVVDWVQHQIANYSNNRFIITSRPFGYRSNPLNGVTVLEVRPFNQEQIKNFIHNWYLDNEIMSSQLDDPGVRMKAKENATDLYLRLRNTPALFALAVNPLLLTMIATVHRYRSSLPGKRVALYTEICEVFLGKHQEARGLSQVLNAAQKQQVLQPLAFYMMQSEKRDIPREEVITLLLSH